LIALKPDDLSLPSRRGNLYAQLGKFDEAAADFDKVLAKDPNYPPALAGKGFVIAKKGDVRSGVAEIQKALELSKDPKEQDDMRAKLRQLGIGPQI
jgi:tetratricopeptide (TPR) repeat protein